MCLHAEAAAAAAARRRIGGLETGGDFAYTAAQTLRDTDLRLHTVPPEPDPRRLLAQALAHPQRLPAATDAHRIATALGAGPDFTAEVFTRIARENGPEREQVDLWCRPARCSTGHARAVAASVASFAAWYCGSGWPVPTDLARLQALFNKPSPPAPVPDGAAAESAPTRLP